MRCALGLSIVLSLSACADDAPGPVDAAPDADASDVAMLDAAPDVTEEPAEPVDVGPAPVRCGDGAVPWPTTLGRCALPDGGTPPVVEGRCTVTIHTPEATRKANELVDDHVVLISGRRIRRATDRIALSGYPMSMLRIPGSDLLVVSDGGFALETLRVVDTSGATLRIPAGGEVPFPASGGSRAPALFYGLAWDARARVVYAAGGGANRIYAFRLSMEGALTPDTDHTIDLGFAETDRLGVDPSTGRLYSAFPAGLALSEDGSELYAALQRGNALGVYSTVTRTMVRVIPLNVADVPAPLPYVIARGPGDARHLYVSLWGAAAVAEVDLDTASVSRTFRVGKNPSEMVFSPDGARLLVTAADEDAISEIDLANPMAPVRARYLGGSASAPRGMSPTALTWGPMNRLYVTEADENAVDVLDGSSFARLGRIPTEAVPTDVDVAPDGRVYVITGRGIGMGPNLSPDTMDVTDRNVGSIARYDLSDSTALARGDAEVTQNNGAMRAFNEVSCPAGAPYDFPLPPVGSGRPSDRIRHVILIVRENKTYDALLGDYEGTAGNPADGDPRFTIAPRAQMAEVFPNFRALVRRFASLDNYYIGSEISNQGHAWTTSGRVTDFMERTWMLYDGRGTRGALPLIAGDGVVGLPAEGDIFAAMRNANVEARNWGEVVGTASAAQRVGTLYPGVFFNNSIPDINKARAFIDRVLGTDDYGQNHGLTCDLPPFTYFTLPNDHTQGGSAGAPTPMSHMQDNDEATGYLIDAVSHSRFWPETLVIVIEDDPAQGGDHVDNHRTVCLLASPWVRRGATSHVHYDESSVHRTIELILGVAPHNAVVAAAAPMYDAFTATPDYAPFTYTPRVACETRNPMSGRWVEATAGMDLSQPDHAPGLDRLVWQMLHNGQEPPWAARPDDDDDDDE